MYIIRALCPCWFRSLSRLGVLRATPAEQGSEMDFASGDIMNTCSWSMRYFCVDNICKLDSIPTQKRAENGGEVALGSLVGMVQR